MGGNQEIKIFEINECEWFAALSSDDAIRAKAELEGCGTSAEEIAQMRRNQEIGDEDIAEVPDAALDELIFHDEDAQERVVQKITFRARLAEMIAAGDKFPCFFASTEF